MDSYNKIRYLNYKNSFMWVISGLFIILLVILSFLLEVYDYQSFLGKYNNGYLVLNVPLINSDVVTNGSYLKINNNTYDYKVTNILENDNENNLDITIYSDVKLFQNESTIVTFYYNKERIIKKIIKFIF